ncbi:MAG: amidase family protein [Filomicrobium sp.]
MKARTNDEASCASRIARILDTIRERDGVVGAYCEVLADQARADAAKMDVMPLDQRGPLCGVGVGIKEVFDVAGGLCGWGSDIHAGRRPKHDAVIVRALRDAGGVILGTTTSTEYAMARMAPTTNPFDPARTPGASSSGSAAAVAAGMADVAIGSQTIGSGIRPAAYCGVFGCKPTQGAFSLSGAMPLADILDHPVIFANEMALVVKTFTALLDSNAAFTAGRISKDNRRPAGALAHAALIAPWFKDVFSADVWEMVHSFARQIPDIDCTLLVFARSDWSARGRLSDDHIERGHVASSRGRLPRTPRQDEQGATNMARTGARYQSGRLSGCSRLASAAHRGRLGGASGLRLRGHAGDH